MTASRASRRKKGDHAVEPGGASRPPGPAPRAAVRHLALVATLAFALYAPTLGAGFVWDDEPLVLQNSAITSLSNLPAIFHSHAFAGTGRVFARGVDVEYYRPVWISTLALDHALWGLRPAGYHLTNVLLHVATALLVYLLGLGLLRRSVPALLAALLFAAHPVHAEAVAWVSGRNELLAALFTCVALAGYARFRTRGGAWVAAGTLVAYGLGLLSKEMAATLPLLALLWEARAGRGGARSRLAGPLVLALATVPYLLLRAAIVTAAQRTGEPALGARLLHAPRILLESLRLMVLPVDLKVFYRLPLEMPSAAPGAWLSVLLLALAVAGIVWLHRRDRDLAFGLGWALVTLLPVCGIPAMIRPAPIADRYLYLPSIGVCLAAGALFARAAAHRRTAGATRAAGAAALVLLLLLSAATVLRSRAWRDDATLMTQMIGDAPGEATGYFNRGLMELLAARLDDAERDFEAAARLTPRDARVHLHLADIWMRKGRTDRARAALAEALRLDPAYVEARVLLGRLEHAAGRPPAAAREFGAALALAPGDLEARTGLGVALQSQGRLDEAEREYRAVLARDPRNVPVLQDLGGLLAERGRLDDAVRVIRRAVAIAPGDATAHYNLAVALEARGTAAEAEAEFRAAFRIDPALEARRRAR